MADEYAAAYEALTAPATSETGIQPVVGG